MKWEKLFEQEEKNLSLIINRVKGPYLCPKLKNIFKAFEYCSYEETKLIILGQDPYYTEGLATGLSFGVSENSPIPRSLINIFLELRLEYGLDMPPQNKTLISWAKQGTLLLNAILTTVAKSSLAHKNIGWETFTNKVIKLLNEKEHMVYMLWGNFARSKKLLITNPKHLILESFHPSPLSAEKGFFNCNHFKLCNEYLEKNSLKQIDWFN